MPILDEDGNLKRVYYWDDLFLNTEKKPKKAIDIPVVIMAGGEGRRLRPLTNVIPKPLIPIGEKTILEVIMDKFEKIGCHDFYLSVNYKCDILKYYISQIKHDYDIKFIKEEKPLGTIGSVSLLKDKISTTFFVSNCDILIDEDYRNVYDYHIANKNDITIITSIKSYKIPYGVIQTGKDGLLTGLSEKPEYAYMINTGVYILEPGLIKEIPDRKFFHITQLIDKVKARGGRVGCFPVSERSWTDIGDWNEYLKLISQSK
jgi:NDP-sugar pyrophosphorylase family protein